MVLCGQQAVLSHLSRGLSTPDARLITIPPGLGLSNPVGIGFPPSELGTGFHSIGGIELSMCLSGNACRPKAPVAELSVNGDLGLTAGNGLAGVNGQIGLNSRFAPGQIMGIPHGCRCSRSTVLSRHRSGKLNTGCGLAVAAASTKLQFHPKVKACVKI
jgi:hypothetical protein